MQLSPLLLLTSLLSIFSTEIPGAGDALQVRSHARDFSVYSILGQEVSGLSEVSELSKRAVPSVPQGKDATKLHVWIRTDERPSTFDSRSGASHEGLNQLMKDTGGRHKDVVIGNPTKGYYEYGLQFEDRSWLTKPNGDGAAVSSYDGPYTEVKGGQEMFEYQGQVKDGRKSLKTIGTIGK